MTFPRLLELSHIFCWTLLDRLKLDPGRESEINHELS
jgi:hypothetical protein